MWDDAVKLLKKQGNKKGLVFLNKDGNPNWGLTFLTTFARL